MQRQPTFSREVLGYLISEIGYGQQAVAFYELIEQAFPITPNTSVKVLDFSKMARANDDDPRMREAIRERTERAVQGEGTMEQVDFKKVDMPDDRYPMENRGWTLWMGYFEFKDTLMVKGAGAKFEGAGLVKSHIAVLRVLYPDTNQHAAERLGRQYILVLHHDPALPDVYQVITYRGGFKQAATSAVEHVEDMDTMLKNAKQKMRDRFNHGYILTWYTQDFPLLEWVDQGGYEVEFIDGYLPPGVQLHLPFVNS